MLPKQQTYPNSPVWNNTYSAGIDIGALAIEIINCTTKWFVNKCWLNIWWYFKTSKQQNVDARKRRGSSCSAPLRPSFEISGFTFFPLKINTCSILLWGAQIVWPKLKTISVASAFTQKWNDMLFWMNLEEICGKHSLVNSSRFSTELISRPLTLYSNQT